MVSEFLNRESANADGRERCRVRATNTRLFHATFSNFSRSLLTVTLVPVFCLTPIVSAGGKGGTAGSPVVPQARMGEPLPGLTASQRDRWQAGRTRYNEVLTVGLGLGPCFNKSSCGNCHNNPTGGTGAQAVTRFGLWDKGVFDPLASLGGSLLQVSAINANCLEVVPPEATHTSLRITNGALAYGLVEAIPDAAILAGRDAQPIEVRGVANMVGAFEDPPMSPLHVGRFGWKAQVATVLTFSADAALNEMGLTNRFVLTENAPNGDLVRLAENDLVADPEDFADAQGYEFIDRVTDFQRFLAHAPQTPKSGMTGEVIFNNLGCAVCHTPSFTTSNDKGLEDAIRNKVIRPYSDWLVHDMGENADFIEQAPGDARSLKTPPLWGLRVRDPMWHDGRIAAGTFAERVAGAIAAHDSPLSQGSVSAQAYALLSPGDKDLLAAFLGSLGQAEFDADGNNSIQLDDFVAFHGCYNPAGPVSPDAPCAIHDVDQSGTIDLGDFESFMMVYVGPRRDCNSNGILDLQEILTGGLLDANNNGYPDSCEPTCDADINGTGLVNIDDLLAVINSWGPCPGGLSPCGADVNFDLSVNIDDLLAVINGWGTCP